jgi:hypothetical protein
MSKVYTFTDTQLLELVNASYINTISALYKEGLLTDENAGKAQHHYSVIIESPQWMPKFVTKWLGIKDDQINMRLVRAVNREDAK